MRIGVVRTVGSPCRCGEAVSEGLKALGHQPVLVDSEQIELRVSELASECDLVIDHTDTFRGRGLHRSLVRLLLEAHGCRVVGSDGKSCFLADDKIAAKACFAAGGIPVPPGISIHSTSWQLPVWLRPPLVLKPAFEHMSRGVRLVETEEKAYSEVRLLLGSLRQPILAEPYIPGRDLAVSLLQGPEGVQVLPALEWRPERTGQSILTEEFKLIEPASGRSDVIRADLPDSLHLEMESMARKAFRLLGLRDYARFDIRLSLGGTLFFLEANTTPSLEPLEAFALSAQWAGLDYPALVDRMLSAALRRHQPSLPSKGKEIRIDLRTGPVALDVTEGVHVPPPSSIELAGLLDIERGEEVLDLGCGSGLFAIAAAKLGAGRVVAADLDPRALEVTQRNARRNGVARQIEMRAGSWYEALNDRNRFDVIIANPPQTPGPAPFGPKYGGPDGTRHLTTVVEGAPALLKPGKGRLWLMAISLANPSALWKRLEESFSEVTLVRETERPFTESEYEALQEHLFEHLLSLRTSGRSEFTRRREGGYVFRNLFIRARGLRER